LDEIRETAEREREAARVKGEVLERLERDRDALMESYAGMVREALENLTPEERHRIYKLLRLVVRFRPYCLWRLRASSRRWGRKQRVICYPANFRHLAYKGVVAGRASEEVTSGIR
jgi:hypothetical protein